MGCYRNVSLLIKGLLYDSKNGYKKASKAFADSDLDVDVSGVVFLITGSNSGIGFETAKAIAKRGGIVHLVCRNTDRAEKSKLEIISETNNQEIYIHPLDLSRVNDVQEFVQKFTKEHGKLDVLINNAGESREKYQKTEADNLEMTFATNVVGPYLLTEGMIPLLKESSDKPRVVTVGSAGMMLHRLDVNYFDKIEPKYDGLVTYAQCKRQIAVLVEIWAKEHPEIHFSCMHPGWVDTPAARKGLGEFYEKMKDRFRNAEEGADTVIWLALSEKALAIKNGSYFQDRKVAAKHLPLARTEESKADRDEFRQVLANITKNH